MGNKVYGNRILTETPVQLCLGDFLKAGNCAFDVGANIGALSVAMSRMVGNSGQVHAFEPNFRIMGYPLAWTTRYMLWSDLELPPTSRRYGTGSTCTAF